MCEISQFYNNDWGNFDRHIAFGQSKMLELVGVYRSNHYMRGLYNIMAGF